MRKESDDTQINKILDKTDKPLDSKSSSDEFKIDFDIDVESKPIDESLKEIEERTKTIYQEYTEHLEKLKDEMEAIIHQENKIVNTTVKTTVEYLKQLKFKDLTDLESSIAKIKLDNKEELLEIRRPSTGRFKGFIYGLFTSALTAGGIFAYGAQLLNMELKPETFLKRENLGRYCK